MGFFTGRVSYERFHVGGSGAPTLGAKQIEALSKFVVGGKHAPTADGISVGFFGGEHLLDLRFAAEKNIVNEAVHFGMRVDASKPPAALKQAYFQMALAEKAAGNPSGFATKKQKAEAKEEAEERLLGEAEDGRYLQMKTVPALWDAKQSVVYFGSSSLTMIERFLPLFREAFGRPLSRITAGTVAHDLAAEAKLVRTLEDLQPAAFTGEAERKYSVSWLSDDPSARDFLGNEFLLWLWWTLEERSDTVKLADDSAVTAMMGRTLALECPLAETGKGTISHEAPVRLPEAKRALVAGKLPRKTGLTLIRHEEQYECALAAETLGISGAAFPKLDSDSASAARIDRVDQLRHFSETIDLLFGSFVKRRLAPGWADELKKLRVWMKKEE